MKILSIKNRKKILKFLGYFGGYFQLCMVIVSIIIVILYFVFGWRP